MSYDFDTLIERRGSGSLKWLPFENSGAIASTYADMDFAIAEPILAAIRERLEHPILGYERPRDSFFETVTGYLKEYHRWQVDREAIFMVPGLVPALNWCAAMAGEAGDEILVPYPIYPPFLGAPGNQHRTLVKVPYTYESTGWYLDIEELAKRTGPNARMIMISNPQNPTGRNFSKAELQALADFCIDRDLILVSDEIHCQLILDDSEPFVSPATLPGMKERTITMLAPSKTYNIPGLACAYLVIESDDLRRRFRRATAGVIPEITPLSFAACGAAYRHGEPWRQNLLAYLRGNRDLVQQRIPEMGLKTTHLEATYLPWIDISSLGWKDPIAAFLEYGAGVHPGSIFGDERFIRLNIGCPRSVLDELLNRMEKAVKAA